MFHHTVIIFDSEACINIIWWICLLKINKCVINKCINLSVNILMLCTFEVLCVNINNLFRKCLTFYKIYLILVWIRNVQIQLFFDHKNIRLSINNNFFSLAV